MLERDTQKTMMQKVRKTIARLRGKFDPDKARLLLRTAAHRCSIKANGLDNQIATSQRNIWYMVQNSDDIGTIESEVVNAIELTKQSQTVREFGKHCSLLEGKLVLMGAQRDCPTELREAVCTIIRDGDGLATLVPEAPKIKKQLVAKYGRQMCPDMGVHKSAPSPAEIAAYKEFVVSRFNAHPDASGEEDEPVFDPDRSLVRGLEDGTVGVESSFVVCTYDSKARPLPSGGQAFKVLMTGPGGVHLKAHVEDRRDGCYRVAYTPEVAGEYACAIYTGTSIPLCGGRQWRFSVREAETARAIEGFEHELKMEATDDYDRDRAELLRCANDMLDVLHGNTKCE